MVTDTVVIKGQERWVALSDSLSRYAPHLSGWLATEDEVREIRFKWRDDGTCLAIAKGYGSDGGETVCFGAGYGFSGAVLAVDRSIQGGNWRADKPWPGKGK